MLNYNEVMPLQTGSRIYCCIHGLLVSFTEVCDKDNFAKLCAGLGKTLVSLISFNVGTILHHQSVTDYWSKVESKIQYAEVKVDMQLSYLHNKLYLDCYCCNGHTVHAWNLFEIMNLRMYFPLVNFQHNRKHRGNRGLRNLLIIRYV